MESVCGECGEFCVPKLILSFAPVIRIKVAQDKIVLVSDYYQNLLPDLYFLLLYLTEWRFSVYNKLPFTRYDSNDCNGNSHFAWV